MRLHVLYRIGVGITSTVVGLLVRVQVPCRIVGEITSAV